MLVVEETGMELGFPGRMAGTIGRDLAQVTRSRKRFRRVPEPQGVVANALAGTDRSR